MAVKHVTIGFAAHVDAGKTTLCEQLLYKAGTIRSLGRVDNGTSALDNHIIEQQRGITIFSSESSFEYGSTVFHILDTPGHVDFSPETERVLSALDCAILVLSAVEGVQSHTVTLFRLLERLGKPVILFINKTDRLGADLDKVVYDIKRELGISPCGIDELNEAAAESSEYLLDRFLEGTLSDDELENAISSMIQKREIFPYIKGCALEGNGIDELLWLIDKYIDPDYTSKQEQPFSAYVYKITNDGVGTRNAYIKILSGTLNVRDELGTSQKVSYLREPSAGKLKNLSNAYAGMICVVGGLSEVRAGDYIGSLSGHISETLTPLLNTDISSDDLTKLYDALRIIEDEEPSLHVKRDVRSGCITVCVSGTVQLEILSDILKTRFAIDASFGEPQVQYLETIADEVIGYGHFEPLRHYAEVHLKLTPSERGSGITFSSACHTDDLHQSFQNLVKTHVFEREIRGMLTGSPLTDVHITLLRGAAHLKHTEGGDFREATYRALRQGLEKAECVLLEPYYAFTAHVPHSDVGKVITDITRFGGTTDYPETSQAFTVIRGRAPMSKVMNYGDELRISTGGKASIYFTFDGYEPCRDASDIISRIGYNKDSDPEYTSSSVFCAKGAGFLVKWYDVEDYIHLK